MSVLEPKLSEISAADFFYRNRSLAGFDNPVRATYTVIRELVENSLDAAEERDVPPKIMISLSFLRDRKTGGNLYRIIVRDNGVGLGSEEIPKAFGRVFVSSKYRLIQSRGTFGLGGTMALLYGQITTHRPFRVISARARSTITEVMMKIDIKKNEPVVLEKKNLGTANNPFTVVESYFEGDYGKARRKIVDYLRQTAIVTPYADIIFLDPDGVLYFFPRSTDEMPPRPKEALYHPKGVDLELLHRLLQRSRANTLKGFLKTNFQRVGDKTAAEVLKLARLPENLNPRKLGDEEIRALYYAIRSYDRFIAPDYTVLSPLSERLFEEGIKKELQPDFVRAVQRPPSVYGGHPFIVETAIAYGGRIRPTGEIQLYRFANRIPLLYDAASDVSYHVVKNINWSLYGIKSLEEEPIALFFHIASTKIPFKTVGKEFIANVPEVAHEVEAGFRACARELKLYLSKVRRRALIAKKAFLFRKFYEIIAENIAELTGSRPSVEILLERAFKDVMSGDVDVDEGGSEEKDS